MINDVFALRRDGALDAAAALGVPVILMHMLGEPRSMQASPQYDDVVADVHRFLAERIFAAEMSGIPKSHLVVDPGFGFGKTIEHNLALLARLERFVELGVPVLAGLSRKRTIGELTGRTRSARARLRVRRRAPDRGAARRALLRVHDVAATVDALKVWAAVAAQPLPRTRDARPRSAGPTTIDRGISAELPRVTAYDPCTAAPRGLVSGIRRWVLSR
jgi:dihydropteroate synthase